MRVPELFLENDKISVASVFEAASFVARTEKPMGNKGRRKGKGGSVADELEREKDQENGGKVS
jgi:hypothetical protein